MMAAGSRKKGSTKYTYWRQLRQLSERSQHSELETKGHISRCFIETTSKAALSFVLTIRTGSDLPTVPVQTFVSKKYL
jgi:hypothetical protein